MEIKGMAHFQRVCKESLVEWYNSHINMVNPNATHTICYDDVFIVWSCKTLQNYKALASTTVHGDGIYAEYTFNGDKGELYEDVYKKLTNRCISNDVLESVE